MSKSFIEKSVRIKVQDFRCFDFPFEIDARAWRSYRKRVFPSWFQDSDLWSLYNMDFLVFSRNFSSMCIQVDKYRKVFIRRIAYRFMDEQIDIVFYNDSPDR